MNRIKTALEMEWMISMDHINIYQMEVSIMVNSKMGLKMEKGGCIRQEHSIKVYLRMESKMGREKSLISIIIAIREYGRME